jgi:hypothetical protein
MPATEAIAPCQSQVFCACGIQANKDTGYTCFTAQGFDIRFSVCVGVTVPTSTIFKLQTPPGD